MSIAIKHRKTKMVIAEVENLSDLRYKYLAGANLRNVDFRGATFLDAVLIGADLRGADLRGARLRTTIFYNADLRGADLRNADLFGTHFEGADLRDADLRGAFLNNVEFTKASLQGAKFSIKAPVVKNIDRAIRDAIAESNLRNKAGLDMCTWHFCTSTHCRGGWAITLAGFRGRRLEASMGSATAAALIYAASRNKPVPDFYASDEAAMASIVKDARYARA